MMCSRSMGCSTPATTTWGSKPLCLRAPSPGAQMLDTKPSNISANGQSLVVIVGQSYPCIASKDSQLRNVGWHICLAEAGSSPVFNLQVARAYCMQWRESEQAGLLRPHGRKYAYRLLVCKSSLLATTDSGLCCYGFTFLRLWE